MRKKITSDNGVELEVGQLGVTVVHPEGTALIWARLSDAQRVELAAALDPGRRGLHVRLDNQAKTLATFQRERDESLRKKGEMVDRAVRAERERDAAVARAKKAEQLIPANAMVDVWVALGRDSIHFDDWYDDRGYADAWAELAAAVREAAEARTAPAVNRADIEKALVPYGMPLVTVEDAVESLHRLVSGADPAVHVVRESDIAAVEVERDEDGDWITDGSHRGGADIAADDLRNQEVPMFLRYLAQTEAIIRAIEAEQAVDPVEELAWKIESATREAIRQVCVDLAGVVPSLDPLTVERAMEVTAASRKVAAHVLGQEASSDE